MPLLSRKTDLPGAYRAARGSCPVRRANRHVPSTDAYLQVLADGLKLVDAIKDIRTALHDQPTRLSKSSFSSMSWAIAVWQGCAPLRVGG